MLFFPKDVAIKNRVLKQIKYLQVARKLWGGANVII